MDLFVLGEGETIVSTAEGLTFEEFNHISHNPFSVLVLFTEAQVIAES